MHVSHDFRTWKPKLIHLPQGLANLLFQIHCNLWGPHWSPPVFTVALMCSSDGVAEKTIVEYITLFQPGLTPPCHLRWIVLRFQTHFNVNYFTMIPFITIWSGTMKIKPTNIRTVVTKASNPPLWISIQIPQSIWFPSLKFLARSFVAQKGVKLGPRELPLGTTSTITLCNHEKRGLLKDIEMNNDCFLTSCYHKLLDCWHVFVISMNT